VPNVTEKLKEIQANRPDGYEVVVPGKSIDMLGKSELWRIYENHPEPHRTRIPQDLIDTPYAGPCAARTPDEWGRCLYFKVV